MRKGRSRTAYVIGSGPNGLTAAIVLARAGLDTTVIEAQPTIGGGLRSEALTLPGFLHDVCSAVHPMAVSSPAFAKFPLAEHGLQWIYPPVSLAHPLDDGSSVLAYRSVAETAEQLGPDARVYKRILTPLVEHWAELVRDILAPPHVPKHPLLLARFGALAPWPAATMARLLFRTPAARALFAGMAAHAILPLEMLGSAAFGWVIMLTAHAVGWPIPRGGSQRIANALASYFESLGGRIVVNTPVRSLDEVSDAGIVLCDITPRQLLQIAGNKLPRGYCRKLERFRYGPGAYKMDWALSAPIPWKSPGCAKAATQHLGGTLDEIAASERAPWEGVASERPFTLVAQPSLFDDSRAPEGKHTAWAYCHVPNGSTEDMSGRIEAQIERFAPGFRATILGRSIRTPGDLEQHNANLVGGDINGGAQDLRQLFLRPTRSLYWTPVRGLYICSASTPPGGGVHGMCGYYAARIALGDAGHPMGD
ncbi:MAG: phytoene desaturase family protein [Bryobacteraceae bacterium]